MLNRNGFVALVIGCLLLWVQRVDAHAVLLSSTPAAKQVVSGHEVPVSLRFNCRIDGKRSRLVVIRPGGDQTVLTIEEQPSADTLSSRLKGLSAGTYVLRWQVLANDGHITRGEIDFRVQ